MNFTQFFFLFLILANTFLNFWMIDALSPGRESSWEDRTVHMPTRQRSWGWLQHGHQPPSSAPDNSPPGTGSVSKVRVAFLLGLILWILVSLQRPWSFIHITGSTASKQIQQITLLPTPIAPNELQGTRFFHYSPNWSPCFYNLTPSTVG